MGAVPMVTMPESRLELAQNARSCIRLFGFLGFINPYILSFFA